MCSGSNTFHTIAGERDVVLLTTFFKLLKLIIHHITKLNSYLKIEGKKGQIYY